MPRLSCLLVCLLCAGAIARAATCEEEIRPLREDLRTLRDDVAANKKLDAILRELQNPKRSETAENVQWLSLAVIGVAFAISHGISQRRGDLRKLQGDVEAAAQKIDELEAKLTTTSK